MESRNAIEHKGWKLPKITYSLVSGKVQAKEPEISGMPVTEFVEKNFDRLICFVEDVTVHCLQSQIAKKGMSLTELPLAQRAPEAPTRFQMTLASGGMKITIIEYVEFI